MDGLRVIGLKPHPRVLVIGDPPADCEAVLTDLTPTFRLIDDWGDVHHAEWDCVVSFGLGATNAGFGLDVLSFGDGWLGAPHNAQTSYTLGGVTTAGVLAI